MDGDRGGQAGGRQAPRRFEPLSIGLLLLLGCPVEGPRCDVYTAARALVPDDARDCGIVRGNPRTVRACMTEAFEAGEAFTGVHQFVGLDSLITVGWAYDGRTLVQLRSDAFGGDDAPRVEGMDCLEATLEDGVPFTCGDTVARPAACAR